jgi:putative oxidoreductase
MNNNTVLLIARVLLAFIFIMAGISKFGAIDGTAGYISSVGLPAGTLLAWLAAIFETVAGIFILIGFKTNFAAYAVALFCLITALVFHFDFTDQTQMIMFMKNLAIAGGLLALSVSGPGSISVDARRS